MKYIFLALVFACFELVKCELPAFPHTSQWKIPQYHKGDKFPTKINLIPFFSQPIHTHQETEQFVRTLEYSVQNDLQGSNTQGMEVLDLNHVTDEELAENIEKDVLEEISIIDHETFKELEKEKKPSKPKPNEKDAEIVPIMLMHQLKFTPDDKYNIFFDGFIVQLKKEFERRQMDPLYFTVHRRGIVKHLPRNVSLSHDMITKKDSNPDDSTKNPVVGGGIITGFSKIRRFGIAETADDKSRKLVKAHFLFGPLDIDFVFGLSNGLKATNSSLSSLTAHALFESKSESEMSLLEFYIDSPMDYEIRMKGSRNKRLERLSNSAITRLFKRSGRMERRLQRTFDRSANKASNKSMKNLKKTNKIKRKKETSPK